MFLEANFTIFFFKYPYPIFFILLLLKQDSLSILLDTLNKSMWCVVPRRDIQTLGATTSGWRASGPSRRTSPTASIPTFATTIRRRCPSTSRSTGTRRWPSPTPSTRRSTTHAGGNVSDSAILLYNSWGRLPNHTDNENNQFKVGWLTFDIPDNILNIGYGAQ